MKNVIRRIIEIVCLSGIAATAQAQQLCPFPNAAVDIQKEFDSLSAKGLNFGLPRTDFLLTSTNNGCYRDYQSGSIYYTDIKTTHELHGVIRSRWINLGREQSVLGYPMTDELPCEDGVGRFQAFRKGFLYWHPTIGARIFKGNGTIFYKWKQHGSVRGFLGYPFTDELVAPDGVGSYQHFQNGSIYVHPSFGAFEVHGAIRALWDSKGSERGYLGYPTSDEITVTCDNTGRYSKFQRGQIYYHPKHGTHMVPRGIMTFYEQNGRECGKMGFPVGDPKCAGGSCDQAFQKGTLTAPGW